MQLSFLNNNFILFLTPKTQTQVLLFVIIVCIEKNYDTVSNYAIQLVLFNLDCKDVLER